MSRVAVLIVISRSISMLSRAQYSDSLSQTMTRCLRRSWGGNEGRPTLFFAIFRFHHIFVRHKIRTTALF
jgi:hypothetical protein